MQYTIVSYAIVLYKRIINDVKIALSMTVFEIPKTGVTNTDQVQFEFVCAVWPLLQKPSRRSCAETNLAEKNEAGRYKPVKNGKL